MYVNLSQLLRKTSYRDIRSCFLGRKKILAKPA